MAFKTSSERLADAVQITCRQRQARLAEGEGAATAAPLPPFTIAISREAGANGQLIARAIGDKLGWAVYDRELVQLLGEQLGVRASVLEDVDEKHTSWLSECLAGFSSTATVSQSGYIRHLVDVLASLAVRGACVVVGRGAAQVLPPATTLRVRLVSPHKERVAVIQKRLGMAREEAEHWVDRTDRERVAFVRDHFNTDPADPRNYDLVLNSARLSIAAAAQVVIEALHAVQAATIAPRKE